MQKKQAKAASESTLFLGLLGAIVVAVNVLGVFSHGRIDATDNQLFSLSQGSINLVGRLEDRLEIRAYFSKDLPPPHNSTERYLRDLLTEYRDASRGRLSYRFISPEDDDSREDAERDGIVRAQDQVLKADSFSVQEGYRGLSFHYLGDTRALPRIDSTAGLEYEITQAIKELVSDKETIGILDGHEGPSISKGLSSLQAFLPNYNLKQVSAKEPLSTELKALLVVDPKTPLSETELQNLDLYVMHGGSLGVFGGSRHTDMSSGQPNSGTLDSGLNTLLEKWGVALTNAIVADAQCGRARLPTQLGIPIAVPYPPAPIITFDETQQAHPVAFRLKQVAVPYTVAIKLNGALENRKGVTTTVLARSTADSWRMLGEHIDLSSRERWQIPAYEGPFPIGVAISGKLPSAFAEDSDAASNSSNSPDHSVDDVHVLVFGAGTMLRDEFMPRPGEQGQFFGGNVAFALNAIDWLANDSDLIAIRAKNVEDPSLEVPSTVAEAEAVARDAYEDQDEEKFAAAIEERKSAVAAWESKKSNYRWGNTFALPFAFALFGFIRFRMRRAKKANLTL